MKKPTIVIDLGHGGVINGEYTTPGKRSPDWGPGIGVLYEGIFNRAVGANVISHLKKQGYAYFCLDSNHDIPLDERTAIYNKLFGKDYICISIHANAAESANARGVEVFTSPGQTASDPVAEAWYNNYLKTMGDKARMRTDITDGDHDKEAKFWVLTKTNGRAILIEHPFMTNKDDCAMLADPAYVSLASHTIILTIEEVLK